VEKKTRRIDTIAREGRSHGDEENIYNIQVVVVVVGGEGSSKNQSIHA
jgi:hypothetical protein